MSFRWHATDGRPEISPEAAAEDVEGLGAFAACSFEQYSEWGEMQERRLE